MKHLLISLKQRQPSSDGGVGISGGPVLLCQALELNKAFPDESGFIGSDGWLTRHKSRNDIVSHKLVGEGNTNSVNTDVVDTFRADVASDLVARYPVEDIDNTNEAGLNYHAVSN